MTSLRVRKVTCPSCGQSAVYSPDNRWRPFCSERCRSVDLGAWASEQFRVPAPAPLDAPGETGADAPPAHEPPRQGH